MSSSFIVIARRKPTSIAQLAARTPLAVLGAAVCLVASSSSLSAQSPAQYLGNQGQHRLFQGYMPPGSIGQARLRGRGPIAGYLQPVAFSGPEETRFALPVGNAFGPDEKRLSAGMLVGAVYRFRITNIPRAPGAELFPTVEVIDRTYPPPGLATKYPIPINLDLEDLEAALEGKMVTRVIVLEDPQTASPLPQETTSSTAIDIAPHQDALETADRLGRPVAIVRIGSVSPPTAPALMPQFFFGSPSWVPVQEPANQPANQSASAIQQTAAEMTPAQSTPVQQSTFVGG